MANFSTPDCIKARWHKKKNYLFVGEDFIGANQGRSSLENAVSNDLFLIELDNAGHIDKTTKLFTTVPRAEPTGLEFSPDGKCMFLNIQHPSATNIFMRTSLKLV